MESSLKNMVIVLTSITLISSASVGAVYQFTKEPIRVASEKKLNDSKKSVLPDFETLGEAENVMTQDGTQLVIYTAFNGDKAVGYAVESLSKAGYSGEIKILVGFTADGKIYKIASLKHAETPGLGAKISNPEDPFVKQFEGMDISTKNTKLKKDGGDLDAITASTITSNAYVDAVKLAHSEVLKKINK